MLVTAGRLPHMRMAIAMAMLVLSTVSLSGSAGVGAAPNAQAPPQVTPRPDVRSILLTDPVPDPKQPGVQWFAPTGHTLRGIFLDYWNRYGGLYQFGYPITEEFFEPVGADNRLLRVQYFERNRFEFHPEFANTEYEVLLGSLGRDFRTQDPPTGRAAGGLFFGETGHNILGTFRAYWETHGGAFVHGYPMTEAYMEKNAIDGKMYLVQYFERSRFELHPEYKGTRYEILLGLLGRQLSEKKGLPYGWYPTYGHAPDFSWVAGQFNYVNSYCWSCGCDFIRYIPRNASEPIRSPGTLVVPVGPVWEDFLHRRESQPNIISHLSFVVAFGHPQGSTIVSGECKDSSDAYYVERAQTNPIR